MIYKMKICYNRYRIKNEMTHHFSIMHLFLQCADNMKGAVFLQPTDSLCDLGIAIALFP